MVLTLDPQQVYAPQEVNNIYKGAVAVGVFLIFVGLIGAVPMTKYLIEYSGEIPDPELNGSISDTVDWAEVYVYYQIFLPFAISLAGTVLTYMGVRLDRPKKRRFPPISSYSGPSMPSAPKPSVWGVWLFIFGILALYTTLVYLLLSIL